MVSDFLKRRLNIVLKDYKVLDDNRELIIRIARDLLNSSVNANRKLSAGDLDTARKHLEDAFTQYHEANIIIDKLSAYDKQYLYKIMDESLKELVEAILFYNRLSSKSLGEDILSNLPSKIFVEGLFDYIGELHRKFLQYLLERDLLEAEKILEELKELYDILSFFVLKSFYIPDFRRKLDLLRNILLKSMEDLATAIYSKRSGEIE